MTQRSVCFLPCREGAHEHELSAHRVAAAQLAALLGCPLGDDLPAAGAAPAAGRYVVPNDTLTSLAQARQLGITGEDDLYGGVVPAPYVATKVITHPLVGPGAAAPAGWCADFPERVRDVVLPGYSTFTPDDAREAARRLLPQGPVRLKRADGIGGSGQQLVQAEAALEAALQALGADAWGPGVVVEQNLSQARALSVGRVRVGGLEVAYIGEQHNTRGRRGNEVYGGSTLVVERGGFEALAARPRPPWQQRAIAHAQAYHEAALACFGGMYASRCNYDVVMGNDPGGEERMGVLEQSWRIGGASGAELAALHAFARDPARRRVRASTVEQHGPPEPLPAHALLYYQGDDPHVGPLTRYALLHDDDD